MKDHNGRKVFFGPGIILAYNKYERCLKAMTATDGASGLNWPGDDDKLNVSYITDERMFADLVKVIGALHGLLPTPVQSGYGLAVQFIKSPFVDMFGPVR